MAMSQPPCEMWGLEIISGHGKGRLCHLPGLQWGPGA